MITTDRLVLKPWAKDQLEVFSRLHFDPVVMADQGGPLTPSEAEVKLDRYIANFDQHGFARWCLETRTGEVIGYCGVMASRRPNHPLGDHEEIGWRLFPQHWGYGYATESAEAALDDVLARTKLDTIYAYTAQDNHRSQSVMHKLKLDRMPSLDFETEDPKMGVWKGLVWQSTR